MTTTASEIRKHPRREVRSLSTLDSVLDAARLMRERGIGGIPVTEDFELVGIFTERRLHPGAPAAAGDGR